MRHEHDHNAYFFVEKQICQMTQVNITMKTNTTQWAVATKSGVGTKDDVFKTRVLITFTVCHMCEMHIFGGGLQTVDIVV